MLGNPTRDRQAERRQATRREILDAAWEIARERGLLEITLRDVAARVGMRAPSLYSHFDSKNAIYDAMFAEAWAEWERVITEALARPAREPRALVQRIALLFFDFAVADPPRYQLMNQPMIPGFVPSAESFAPSQRAVTLSVGRLADLGVTDRGEVEINFAILSGLINQQLANDPDGDSRRRLVRPAMEMWADGVGLPERGAR